jgi:hypothetical protein
VEVRMRGLDPFSIDRVEKAVAEGLSALPQAVEYSAEALILPE